MMNRIDIKMQENKKLGKLALVPFLTAGFPDIETSEELAVAIIEAGADMLELGVPFSDPLADGATVQLTSLQALERGVTLNTCLKILDNVRNRGVNAPLIFMGYLNPFIQYGFERFVLDASRLGLDGIIIPDLPVEEAAKYQDVCEKFNVHLIPLLTPTSTDSRIALTCVRAKGFIYCVSIAGVTGDRRDLAPGLSKLVRNIRKHTDLPVLIGFGVSTREHIEDISGFADGAVVGSALLNVIIESTEDNAIQPVKEFISRLLLEPDQSRGEDV